MSGTANAGHVKVARGDMPGGVEPLSYIRGLLEEWKDTTDRNHEDITAQTAALTAEQAQLKRQLETQQEELNKALEWCRQQDAIKPVGAKLWTAQSDPLNSRHAFNAEAKEFGLYLLDIANFRNGGPPNRFQSEHFKRAQSVGTAAEGGFLVAPEQFPGVHQIAEKYGVARNTLSVFEMEGNEFRIPTLTGRPSVYWPNEGAAPGSQSTTQFGRPAITSKRMVAWDKITMELNTYTAGFIGRFLAQVFATAVAKEEDYQAFVAKSVADGGSDPFTGLLNTPSLPEVTMAGDLYKELLYNEILDLIDAVSPHALDDSVFLYSNSINLVIRKIKDDDGRPLATEMIRSNPQELFGYRIVRSEVMPRQTNPVEGSQPATTFMLFGDLKQHSMGISKNMMVDFSEHADFAAGNIVMRVMEFAGFQPLILSGIGRMKTHA